MKRWRRFAELFFILSFHNIGVIDNVDMRIVYFYVDFVIFRVWTISAF